VARRCVAGGTSRLRHDAFDVAAGGDAQLALEHAREVADAESRSLAERLEGVVGGRVVDNGVEHVPQRALGRGGEPGEQGATEPAPLPVIGDGGGDLHHAGLAGDLDIADDGDAAAGERIDREQRLATVVIDVDQAIELALGQRGLAAG